MDLFASFILVPIGGFMRYLWGFVLRKLNLSNAPYYSLKEYIFGSNRKEDEDWDKGNSHEFVNKVIGLITLIALCYLLI